MKNRNLILSVLLWVVCSSVFAVTLPSISYHSSYVGENGGTENIILGTGTSYTQVYLTSSSTEYADACYTIAEGDVDECLDCCEEYEDACPPGDLNCYDKVRVCKTTCHEGPSLPLGTPLMLLPFIAVYAVLRKRKQA